MPFVGITNPTSWSNKPTAFIMPALRYHKRELLPPRWAVGARRTYAMVATAPSSKPSWLVEPACYEMPSAESPALENSPGIGRSITLFAGNSGVHVRRSL